MPEDKGSRSVGVSDMPKTIKGYMWFEEVAGRAIKIDGVSLLGNNKGATRYAAIVVCKSRNDAKEFARKVKDRREAPRAKLLNSDEDAEKFRQDMIKNKGWSADAPDGDKAITSSSGADIRGDATGFKHGFNPYKKGDRDRSRSRRRNRSGSRGRSRSRSRKRSPSPRKRSPSPKKRSPSPRKRSPSPRKRSPSRPRSSKRQRTPSPKKRSRSGGSRDRGGGGRSRGRGGGSGGRGGGSRGRSEGSRGRSASPPRDRGGSKRRSRSSRSRSRS